jgi:hypothetical protein
LLAAGSISSTISTMSIKRNNLILLLIILSLLMLPRPLLATKPCPPSPCLDKNGKLDDEKCRVVSEWIAVGTITKIKHDRKGYPLNKDFAEFTLNVIQWEKGDCKKLGKKLRFKVGWCQNQFELPKETGGLFRFYGTYQTEPIYNGLQYYYFERIKE